MKTFLEYVAEDIIRKYGTDLSNVAVVFPNKRAALFLNEYLAKMVGKPIWSPAYITISDLFRQHSDRIVGDPIQLVCLLHQSFVRQTGIDETLDHFYGWGQLLLTDFDDIDKNMADADKVFANLRDIHELDDVSYLTDAQKEVLRKFFSNFSDDHNSMLKDRFLKLWSHMGDIYHDYNQLLEQRSLAYEGALYREVAQREDIPFRYDHYLFVGFNLLQQVEQRLFTLMTSQGKARFYWDFDRYYMNEAGHFIGQYLAHFPNELDIDNDDIYNCFARPKELTYISAPTENIQARYVAQWLNGQWRITDGRQTAIVLCNEGLLQTVIRCLPDEVAKVNITTGYPMVQTPAASFITVMVNLQTLGYDRQRQRFRQRYLKAFSRHPYFKFLSEDFLHPLNDMFFNTELLQWMAEGLQMTARQSDVEDPLFQESVFRAYTLVNRLLTLVNDGDLQVDVTTLQRLIAQLIQTTSIPFHGEPAEGLQVMGVLETRNLDFRHVLLLSCNEGNMPKGVNDTSFIPYSIRKAYGLTTIDHKVAIFSYYFHRMLQRAEDVTILYNNATTDGQKGEMSRFLLQLMVESRHQIQFRTLQAGQSYVPFQPQPVRKTASVLERMQQVFALTANDGKERPLLTPTAINRYMRCPLQFYYNYVKGLREPLNIEEDEIDSRIFGNIFHEASQTIYTRLMDKSRRILASDIEQLLKAKVDIERAVDEALRKELMLKPGKMELNGLQLINREVIIHYVCQLLKIDQKLAPFTIIDLEGDVMETLVTRHLTTTIGGRIDRLDMITDDKGEHIRVIDYKTGSKDVKALPDVDSIFSQESLKNHSDYYMQTFIYAKIVKDKFPDKAVSPALLFIQHAGADDYNPILKFDRQHIDDVAQHMERFMDMLKAKVDEIFDPETDFVPTADRDRCTLCPYKGLCSLSNVKS